MRSERRHEFLLLTGLGSCVGIYKLPIPSG